MTEIILGPPGTGKTTTCLDVLDQELRSGTDPARIGFVSFTNKAANEAADRACARFNYTRSQFPHFRTIHSMCFRQLGLSKTDVLQGKSFNEFADWAGIRVTGRAWSDDGLLEGFEAGDRILFMENLSRIRRVSLRQQYEIDDDGLNWNEVARVSQALRDYKAQHALLDFTDMLSEFLQTAARPDLDVLIVDEAQDLSALQWLVVDKLSQGCRRVVIAGDDDQAIFRWAGADVEHLVDMDGNSRVLGQSWRCPPLVQNLSASIIRQVRHRRDKKWRARDGERGEVRQVSEFANADIDDKWSDENRPPVMILARNTFLLKQIEYVLRQRGIVFERSHGGTSLSIKALRAAEAWTRLARGEAVELGELRVMYEFLSVGDRGVRRGFKKLTKFGEEDDRPVVMRELREDGGLMADDALPWHEALDKMPQEDVSYMRAARRRGDALRGRPRVRVSTIHSAKGGEADHVVLLSEMARRTHKEMEMRPEDEMRVWYVAVTRARSRLTVVAPGGPLYCPWI